MLLFYTKADALLAETYCNINLKGEGHAQHFATPYAGQVVYKIAIHAADDTDGSSRIYL